MKLKIYRSQFTDNMSTLDLENIVISRRNWLLGLSFGGQTQVSASESFSRSDYIKNWKDSDIS